MRGIIDFVAPCHPVPPCGADMDQAFGSPEEPVALDPAVQRLAKADNVAVTVTLLPDGQPHALPTWIDTDGEHLLVNTEPQRQKVKNVRRDPRVTVLIVDKANPFDFAEVRGRVVETVGGDEARRHIDELSQRYTGGPYQNPIGEQGRVILKIAPDRQLTAAALFGGG
jgi:PPOX class probable F420-dependent enzyme